jgi:hypothetical protein
VVEGLTLRVAGLVVRPDCTSPSLQVIDHGGAPVSAALTVVEPPGQIVASPLTVAVGGEITVRVMLLLVMDAPHDSVNRQRHRVWLSDALNLRPGNPSDEGPERPSLLSSWNVVTQFTPSVLFSR